LTRPAAVREAGACACVHTEGVVRAQLSSCTGIALPQELLAHGRPHVRMCVRARP
jgi:hypothetical protein